MTLQEVLAAVSPLMERIAVQERELAEVKQRLAAIETKCILDYRGVWVNGRRYERGDCTTWDGGIWIAQAETEGERPGNGATAWKLAVKRGDGDGAGPVQRFSTQARSWRNGR